MTTTYTAYRTRNSPFLVEITDFDGTVYTSARMASITRIQLKYIPADGEDAEPADSAAVGHEDVFDWATYATTGKCKIDIGLLDFTAGRDSSVEVIVYDTDYPEGRVLNELMDILVSADAEDGSDLTPILLTTPLTVTDDYDILHSDFNRSSIRLNAVVLKTLALPVMTSAYDGARLTVIIENVGDGAIAADAGDTIVNDTHTTFTGTTKFGSTMIEYDWSLRQWMVLSTVGSWGGS